MKVSRMLFVELALGLLVSFMLVRPASAQTSQQIVSTGTSSFQASSLGGDALASPEIDPGMDNGDDGTGSSVSPVTGPALNITVATGSGQGPSGKSGKKAKSNPQLNLTFDGLNHRQQRLADNGNQFSVEPPDQGLCAGNGFVMEAVNDIVNVYDTSGNSLLGPVSLNRFFGYASAIVRPSTFGADITDPSCYFDPDTQRWFLVVLTLDRVGTSASLAGTNHLDIAVSTTSSPLGSFVIYKLPVQDDGTQGTPNHNCAGGFCLGDYPHIGADANGFYMTTNEFNLFAPGFIGSQIYAASKSALASGAPTVTVFQFDTRGFTLDGNPGFTVWPATTPAMAYSTDANGTEYFLSSVAVFSNTASDNRIRLWALSNTQSLNTTPALVLNTAVLTVNPYAVPPKADQKVGDIPLGTCINDTTTVITSLGGFTGCWKALFGGEPAHNETESQHVDSNDSRMQQVVFANGKLWSALDTAVTLNNANKAGVAWFILKPSATTSSVSASVAMQGVVGLANNNLTYPAVGVTNSGRGVISFTLLGLGDGVTDFGNFPTAAYVSLDAQVGAGDIHIAAPGLGPQDGFTSYKAFVGNGRNRWGDYGATAIDGNSIWMAAEYIGQTCSFATYISAPFGGCGGTRSSLGNWGTRISKVTP